MLLEERKKFVEDNAKKKGNKNKKQVHEDPLRQWPNRTVL